MAKTEQHNFEAIFVSTNENNFDKMSLSGLKSKISISRFYCIRYIITIFPDSMSNWKSELGQSIWYNNESEFDQILSRPQVQREISSVKEWKRYQDPVNCAAYCGRNSMLEKLLKAGADPNCYRLDVNDDKWTPIHNAISCNRIEAVKILLKYGANENLVGNTSKSIHMIINISICKISILINLNYSSMSK